MTQSYFNYLRTKKWDAFDFIEALLLIYPFKILFQIIFDTQFRIRFYTTPFGFAFLIILALITATVICFIAYMHYKYHKGNDEENDKTSKDENKKNLNSEMKEEGKKRIFFMALFIVIPLAFLLGVMDTAAGAGKEISGCTIPKDGMIITENTLFCTGSYTINGITITERTEKEINIDCNNSIISGAGSSKGITIENTKNITLKNCNIQGYDIGIYIKNTTLTTISESSISKNRVGIRLIDSFENTLETITFSENKINLDLMNSKYNTFIFKNMTAEGNAFCEENSCDKAYLGRPCSSEDGYCGSTCLAEEDKDCKELIAEEALNPSPELALEYYQLRMKQKALEIISTITGHEEAKKRLVELIENGRLELKNYIDPAIKDSLLKQLGITNKQYEEALKKIEIKKYVYVAGDRTIFEITIIAKDKTENLVLYEYFPEELEELIPPENAINAINAFEEKSSKEKNGNSAFKIFLGEIDVDASTKIEFSADKKTFFKEMPTTIPADQIIPPESKKSFRTYNTSNTKTAEKTGNESETYSKKESGIAGITYDFSNTYFWIQLLLAYACSFFFTQYIKYRIKIKKQRIREKINY